TRPPPAADASTRAASAEYRIRGAMSADTPLEQHPSTVDDDGLTGHVVALHQIEQGAGDVFGAAEPLQCGALPRRPELLLRRIVRRQHGTRRDAVGPDVRRERACEHAREVDETGLRYAVMRIARPGLQRGQVGE